MKQAIKYFKMMNRMENNNANSVKLDLDDFVQEGMIGLMTAVDKYDINHPSKATFNTYSFMWIRQGC